MNVALYMRYSSERQTEQSIEGQDRVCTNFCKTAGHNIVEKYIDRATSAFKNTDRRTEFQRLMNDSSKGIFDAVVVYKLDRFARNRYDSATYKARLKKNGVKVISATENISDNPEGIILESVLEGMAEFYSQELSQKVRRGMNENALKFKTLGGQIPLGYKFVDKKYAIDEERAPLVVEAFERYASGESMKRICDDFNLRGFRTSRGSKFNKSSFAKMFQNKRYIGTYVYKDQETPNAIPAIVDKELFEKVSMKMKENTRRPGASTAKTEYLLSGKLFCGHCGYAMNGMYGTSHTGKKHYYYSCHTRRKDHTCDKRNVDKDAIEKWVIDDTCNLLVPEVIDQIADIAVDQSIKEVNDEGVIAMLENKIADIDSRRANLIKALEITPEVTDIALRLKELTTELKSLESELAKEKNNVFILDKEEVVFFLQSFLNGDRNDLVFQKRVIDMLVNRVDVYDTDEGFDVKITFNCNGANGKPISSTVAPKGQPLKTSSNFQAYKTYISIIRKHA